MKRRTFLMPLHLLLFAIISEPVAAKQAALQSRAMAPTAGVDDIFEEWLTAFNSGDEMAIRSFYREGVGDPVAQFPLDLAVASCGFELVRVESRTASSMTVLLIEKCFPTLQRLTIELGQTGEKKLAKFDLAWFCNARRGGEQLRRGIRGQA